MSVIQVIKEKYEKMNVAVKLSFWFAVCSFLQKGIGFVTTPIFTRVMTETEYGRFNIYNSWASIFEALVTLSISGNCFTRGLVIEEDAQKRKVFTSSLQGLITTLTFAFFIVYLFFREKINLLTGISTYLFALMFVGFLLTNACYLWTNRKRIEYDYKSIVVLTMLFSILRPVVSIISIKGTPLDYQVEARVTAITIVNLCLFGWIYFSIFAKGRHFFDWGSWKYALAFCIPLIPHYLSKTMLNQSDRIMIGAICGDKYTSYYSVAYAIAAILSIFNSAIAQALDPWIYRSIKNRSLDKVGPVSYRILVVMAIINVFVMALAPEVLAILAPSNYDVALYVIPPVTASVFFSFMYDLFASFPFYYKKTWWIATATCGGAILNIALNALFIPRFGFVAAGYTTLLCNILFGVLNYIFMKRTCNKYLNGQRVYNPIIIFGVGVFVVLTTFGMIWLYSHLVIRYLLILMILVGVFVKRRELIAWGKRVIN